MWGVSEIRGTLFWGPYNKDPTGYYIRVPIFSETPMSASGLGVDVWWVRVGGVRISVVFDFRSLGVQRLGIYLTVHATY